MFLLWALLIFLALMGVVFILLIVMLILAMRDEYFWCAPYDSDYRYVDYSETTDPKKVKGNWNKSKSSKKKKK